MKLMGKQINRKSGHEIIECPDLKLWLYLIDGTINDYDSNLNTLKIWYKGVKITTDRKLNEAFEETNV